MYHKDTFREKSTSYPEMTIPKALWIYNKSIKTQDTVIALKSLVSMIYIIFTHFHI